MAKSVYSSTERTTGSWVDPHTGRSVGGPTMKIFGTNPKTGHLETKAYSGSEADYKIGPHGYATNEQGHVLVPDRHRFSPSDLVTPSQPQSQPITGKPLGGEFSKHKHDSDGPLGQQKAAPKQEPTHTYTNFYGDTVKGRPAYPAYERDGKSFTTMIDENGKKDGVQTDRLSPIGGLQSNNATPAKRSPANSLARDLVRGDSKSAQSARINRIEIVAKNSSQPELAKTQTKAVGIAKRYSSIKSLQSQSAAKAKSDTAKAKAAVAAAKSTQAAGGSLGGDVKVKAHTDSKGKAYKEFTRKKAEKK